jgi:tyrosine-protein kinase Etk/Wzc
MTEETSATGTNKSNLSPREIALRYMHYLPWVILSIALFLIGAFLKIRYTTPIYSVSAKLQVKNQSHYAGSGEKFDDIFMMQGASRNLSDEIEIIKSRPMATRVVKSLKMQLQILNKGSIRTSKIYLRDAPFNVHIIQLRDSSVSFNQPITVLNDQQFRLGEDQQVHSFGEILNMPYGKLMLVRNSNNLRVYASNEFILNYQPAEQRAVAVKSTLNVAQANDFSSVLTLTYLTENIKIGLDIVNQYMEEFEKFSLEEKRSIAVKTLAFIDEQLDTVRAELGGVENSLQQYRERNKIFAPEQQSLMSFSEISESVRELTRQQVKLKVIDYLVSYIGDPNNPYRIVPATLGIDEPLLVQQITEYNKLQLDRETSLKSMGASHPALVSMQAGIENLRKDMLENLKNIRETYQLSIRNLEAIAKGAESEIRAIPQKEKQLLEVTRQQSILQELYSYLLQKKLETSIASASTMSNIRIIEPATGSGNPVSPNKNALYVIALVLGIGVPAGIIFLLEFLNDKVTSKSDVEKHTTAPILGEIGHAENSGALVVTSNNRQFIAEQFRIVRSNLQYILPRVPQPVIMVTSSFSGEGKSFISTNLGAVLAISGKKTVILEFDIRKPKILKGLGLNERKGITNFIVGSVDISQIIYPVPDVDNLFVIPCGPVPPNPAELLLNTRVKEMFEELRRRFDVIIVDTAPVGLVSDSITLGQFANAVVYIVRHNYTLKKQIGLVEELYTNQKLPHLSIIINDIKQKAGYGGYYGYGGYGYGYGYGFSSNNSYFDNGNKPSRPFWKRIFSRSKKA